MAFNPKSVKPTPEQKAAKASYLVRCIDCRREYAERPDVARICTYCQLDRNGKMTPERQQTICREVRAGVSLRGACGLAGIPETTVHNWLRRGMEEGLGPYYDFCIMLLRAEGELEKENIQVWREQALADPTAMKEYMSRRFKTTWSEKVIVEEKKTIEVKSTLRIDEMNEEQLDALEKVLEASGERPPDDQLLLGSVVPSSEETH